MGSEMCIRDRVQNWKETDPSPLDEITVEELDIVPQVGGYEYIDSETACGEAMFLGLRLLGGMDLAETSANVGCDLQTHFGPQIKELLAEGLLVKDGSRLLLSKPAYLIANQVFTKFVR